MKKYVSLVVILMVAFLLVGCNNNKDVNVDEVSQDFDEVIAQYTDSDTVQAKVTFSTNGDKTQEITVNYVKTNGMISSMGVVENKYTASETQEMSVFVKDGVAYLNRLGEKTFEVLTTDENSDICEDYLFNSYIDGLLEIYNTSFFNSCEVTSSKDDSVLLECNLETLQVDPALTDTEDILAAQNNINNLQAKSSITLTINYTDDKVTSFEGEFVGDTTDLVKVEFLSTTAVDITYPELSAYTQAD